MIEVEMYATAVCPYCRRARQLLKRLGIAYREIRIDEEPARMAEMVARSRRETVPQIFIGGQHVGGYDDLAARAADGTLAALLRGESPVAPEVRS